MENNLLTFIKDTGKNKHGKQLALFQCKCGNTKETIKIDVIKNRVKSCGCLRKETAKRIIEQYNSTQLHSNKIWIEENYAFIQFNNCNDIVVIDKEDLAIVQSHVWHKDSKGYRIRT